MKIKKNEILKLRNELSDNCKSLNSIKNIKKWYRNIIKKSKIKVKTIPLNKCNNWKINAKGQMIHATGSFYRVEGVRVIKSFKREVIKGWDQPMFTEPGYDGGILGLLKKDINKSPHYLINAKFEPGNYKFIQLSPTVQATFSNIKRSHGGREVKYLKYFKYPKKIIAKSFLDSGYLKREEDLKIREILEFWLNTLEKVRSELDLTLNGLL